MTDTPPEPDRARHARLHSAGPALVSAALALALYAITLGGTYVYDDVYVVQDDPRLRDPAMWRYYWTRDYFLGGVDRLYRPLVSMSYALQWHVHGDRPWAFHAVNWLLHAAVSATLAELARRLCGGRVAWAAGLLFAAHPVHVEAVANVVGRAELMCALGTLGALVLAARRPMTYARAGGVFGCFVLALLSKEQGMLLPLLLLTLGWTVGRTSVRARATDRAAGGALDDASSFADGDARAFGCDARAPERKATMALVLAVCWSVAGYVLWRETWIRFWWDRGLLDWTVNPLIRSAGVDRWLVPLALLGRYTGLLVAPWKLAPDYGGLVISPAARWDDPHFYVGAAALLLWTVLFAVTVRRRAWPVSFCLLALGITYGMVANVITLIGTVFAERLMYLPSAFFVVVVATGLVRLRPRAMATTLLLLVALGSLKTWTYARRWNDRLAFYAAAVEDQPRSVQVYLLLSNELRLHGDFGRAEAVAAAVRRLAPDHWEVYYYSALIALDRGDLDAAERFASDALRRKQALPAIGVMMEVRQRKEERKEGKVAR